MAKKQTLKFRRTVNAPPAEVFLALTNATALREWFSDTALLEPRQGGRVYFAWNQGYFAAGEVTKLNPGKKLGFSWRGRGEPDQTQVEISVAPKKDGSSVTVLHSGLGGGKKWKAALDAISRGWETGLENLQSVMETGHDLRVTLRPMLGVTGLDEVTPEMAEKLGIPVTHGVRIEGTVAGMGAEAAGLKKDDVLVNVGGEKVANWPNLVTALGKHRAGEKLPVSFYRGAEKHKETLELSKRPLPELPASAGELADAVRKIYAATDLELETALAGVSDEAASARPGPDEWNVKEVLSHLVQGERDTHAWAAELVAGEERLYNGFSNNSQIRTQATAAALGSASELLQELKRHEAETVALVAALPDPFVNRKRTYWRMATSLVQTADHTREHLRQLQAAAGAARQPEPAAEANP